MIGKLTPDKMEAILAEMEQTYRQRNEQYGSNFLDFGFIMVKLFENPRSKVKLNADEWVKLGLLVQIVSKLTRYVQSDSLDTKLDTLKDMAVYAQMLHHCESESGKPDFLPMT